MPSSSRGHPVRCARPTWRRCARPVSRRRRSLRRPLSPPTSITPIVWRRGWGSTPRVDRSLRPPLARRYTVGQPTQAGMAELADAKVSKTFERKLVRVRPPLPAPFKSSTCSTDSFAPWCFRSKIVPEMCLRRFRERDDRARGEALDLMETRQLLAAGYEISLRDDGIAAVDRLRLVPDHLHRDRSRHARALKVSHRAPSQVMRHDAGHADLAARRSEEHTSELQSRPHLVCRLLLEKKKKQPKRKTRKTKKKNRLTT